ncbi:cytosine-specific methyltransferase [Striga asiatica]|uniref:Cytosine-specific methyltransferase n=1 Tax=Striga asiatica TaxID=4170 RepID=A0A5A7PVX2_STRAF|nr:cytosine-specific methyltransferase [Striga asiatica]
MDSAKPGQNPANPPLTRSTRAIDPAGSTRLTRNPSPRHDFISEHEHDSHSAVGHTPGSLPHHLRPSRYNGGLERNPHLCGNFIPDSSPSAATRTRALHLHWHQMVKIELKFSRYIQVGNAVAVPIARALRYSLALAIRGLSGEGPLLTLPDEYPIVKDLPSPVILME